LSGPGDGVVVRVAELAREADGSFRVRVSFGDATGYDVRVGDPADAAAEKLFKWYFEEHLRYPFLDKDLEEAAEARITAYGEALFAQVLSGAAAADYRQLRDQGFDGCRIEVSGSAGLHRLHWEALRDPDLPVPLAVRVPVTRRAAGKGVTFSQPRVHSALNVLVVTARPSGPGDAGYRTVSRPLMDAVQDAGLPVRVDLVRPGTWQALTGHLRAATEVHGAGWYQVVHFDMHGAFVDHATLAAGREGGGLVFGPDEVAAFAGRRGFVFFETSQAGKARPVAAQDLAALLAAHRVPVAVLNACQSAMQDDSEAGLAQQLAEAGVPVAVGMAYSVTVSAAERAMPVLYQAIAAGADLTAAVLAARRNLLDHPARGAYFGRELDLADWMLPVMFIQQPFRIRVLPAGDAERPALPGQAEAAGEEPATEYGFVGRDLDIQAIEHRILSGDGILLVQGMAGAGKSALLAHLAWWWQRTGLVDQAFAFSFEDRAWTAGQIVREIRARLLPPAEHARADITLSAAEQADQVVALLRETRHLLILDNFESVTAAPGAIPHTLSPAEQDKLKTLLSRLAGGRTLVLIGSRQQEEWLGGTSAGIATYALPGLDPQAASVLVDRILASHGDAGHLADARERAALGELVSLLGGYPLPLTVVVPTLASAKPSAVVAELKAGGPSEDWADVISQAMDYYSYSKLDPALQAALQLLAPFTAVIPRGDFLRHYQDILLSQVAAQGLGEVDLAAALAQAIAVGLASPHSQIAFLARVQPVLPWFLRSRLRNQPALQDATAQAHYQYYSELALTIYQMLTSTASPEERPAGTAAVQAEYANLTAALDYALRTGQLFITLVTTLNTYLDQARQHETRRELLDTAIAKCGSPTRPDQQHDLAVLRDTAGQIALTQRRLDDARTHYQAELRLLEASGEKRYNGGIYHQLARVASEQGRFAEAEASYRQALAIFLKSGDRLNASTVHHSLGHLARKQGRFAEAEASLRQALAIKLESGDRPGAAGIYHTLGMVAEGQGRFAEAEASHQQALRIFLEFHDRAGTARALMHLGIAAQMQGRLAEAETRLRRALDIELETGDRRAAATTAGQLGRVAENQGRFAEAEASYRQALAICLESGDQTSAAISHHQLGIVAQMQGKHAEAEASYRQALAIKLDSGNRHGAAVTYHQLARVAHEQGRFDEAEALYRQTLAIHLDSGDRHGAAPTYHQLGEAAREQGRLDEAEASYLEALDIYLESGDRKEAVRTCHQLGKVAEQKGQFTKAEARYRQALAIQLVSGDLDGAAVSHYLLGNVARAQGRLADAEKCYRQALGIFLESGGGQRAAITYGYLGNVVKEQGRLAEAEVIYRRAADTAIKTGDWHSSAVSYHKLAMLAQEQERSAEALLYAAVAWYQEAGDWNSEHLALLHRERGLLTPGELEALAEANVPAELAGSLITAVENAADPGIADEADKGRDPST
jgi:tetratricopeptide (TPR) repeat protein